MKTRKCIFIVASLAFLVFGLESCMKADCGGGCGHFEYPYESSLVSFTGVMLDECKNASTYVYRIKQSEELEISCEENEKILKCYHDFLINKEEKLKERETDIFKCTSDEDCVLCNVSGEVRDPGFTSDGGSDIQEDIIRYKPLPVEGIAYDVVVIEDPNVYEITPLMCTDICPIPVNKNYKDRCLFYIGNAYSTMSNLSRWEEVNLLCCIPPDPYKGGYHFEDYQSTNCQIRGGKECSYKESCPYKRAICDKERGICIGEK